MIEHIYSLEQQFQALYNRLDFSNLYRYGRFDVGKLSATIDEFAKPANLLVQQAIQENPCDEFKMQVSKLIQKYRTAIAAKYTSESLANNVK